MPGLERDSLPSILAGSRGLRFTPLSCHRLAAGFGDVQVRSKLPRLQSVAATVARNLGRNDSIRFALKPGQFWKQHNHPRGNDMSLFSDLLEKPANLSTGSKYSVMSGYVYIALGAQFIVWPGSVQTIFMHAPFVGKKKRVLPCDWHGGRRNRLALPIRRSFWRSTIRPGFRAR